MTLQMLTRSAALAAWSSAALRHEVGVEQVIDALHAVRFEPLISIAGSGERDAEPDRFALSVGRWRSLGVLGWRYVPVAPADSHGIPGPSKLLGPAMDAGAALISVGGPPLGLVPVPATDGDADSSGKLQTFVELPTTSHGVVPPESVGDLDRALLAALTEVVDFMEGLELARWRDDIYQLMQQWAEPPHMPPGTPDRAQRLAARSERVLALVELASDDEGGSRTASEMELRASALRNLGRIARAAHAAGWNAGLVGAETRR